MTWKKEFFCLNDVMDFDKDARRPFRPQCGFSFPELLVLFVLVFFTAAIAIPAAYPYLTKAHRQAHTIRYWEESSSLASRQAGF